jgi:F420-0:gamma-glutamyl ligase
VNIGLETINSNPSFTQVIKDFFKDWISSLSDLYRNVLDDQDAIIQAERVVAELEGSVIMMKILGDVNYLKRSSIRILNEFKELEKNKISKVYND